MKWLAALLHPLGRLLTPIVNRPAVQAVLVPTCLIAGGVQAAFSSAADGTWQSNVAVGAGLVVAFCAGAGIASAGVSSPPVAKALEESGEHPAAKPLSSLVPKDPFDKYPKF